MRQLLVINGPNLNMLGIREPEIYGTTSYADLVTLLETTCEKEGIGVDIYQSNHEGAIVDRIQAAYKKVDGIIINPAAYSHTSIAILDAFKSVNIPTIEVHLSDLATREAFRQHSYVSGVALCTICGKGIEGYVEAVRMFSKQWG